MRSALFACGLAIAVALFVAACGGDDSGSSAAPPAGDASQLSEGTDSSGDGAAQSPPADSALSDEGATDPTAVSDAVDSPEAGSSMNSSVSCELTVVPSQVPLEGGIVHVESLPEGFAYNSVPASQGPHHPEWLRWGVYEEPVPELNAVHNLEHGGITVQYGRDISLDTVAQILDWYAEDTDAIIVAPHDGLGGDIALAGWTVEDIDQGSDAVYRSSEGNVLRCDGFDEPAFSDFRQNYRGRAPERIPLEQMPAGS